MLHFILWYILITLLGLLTFPLTFKLLPGLADRGYTLARALGLLIWGYLFWVLGSFGLLQNDFGGELLSLLVLAVLGIWAFRSLDGNEVHTWFRKNRRIVLITEVLFMVAFLGWAFVHLLSFGDF